MSNPNDPAGTIPVELGAEYIQNWLTYLEADKPAFAIKSYWLSIDVFKNIVANNPNAEAVRVHLGLTSATDPMASQLVLIPIVDGHEVPYSPTADEGVGLRDGGSNTYDQSRPCPPYCP